MTSTALPGGFLLCHPAVAFEASIHAQRILVSLQLWMGYSIVASGAGDVFLKVSRMIDDDDFSGRDHPSFHSVTAITVFASNPSSDFTSGIDGFLVSMGKVAIDHPDCVEIVGQEGNYSGPHVAGDAINLSVGGRLPGPVLGEDLMATAAETGLGH